MNPMQQYMEQLRQRHLLKQEEQTPEASLEHFTITVQRTGTLSASQKQDVLEPLLAEQGSNSKASTIAFLYFAAQVDRETPSQHSRQA